MTRQHARNVPLRIWQQRRPFQSPSNRLRATIAIKGLVDVGALDSNIQAVGQLRIQRRTDISIRTVRIAVKPRGVRADLDNEDLLELLRRRRREGLVAFYALGELTDEELIVLSEAA